jgi:hypothetical protein
MMEKVISSEVKLAVRQGSELSPQLFKIVSDATSEICVSLPWQLFYADDLCLLAETEKELRRR